MSAAKGWTRPCPHAGRRAGWCSRCNEKGHQFPPISFLSQRLSSPELPPGSPCHSLSPGHMAPPSQPLHTPAGPTTLQSPPSKSETRVLFFKTHPLNTLQWKEDIFNWPAWGWPLGAGHTEGPAKPPSLLLAPPSVLVHLRPTDPQFQAGRATSTHNVTSPGPGWCLRGSQ